MANPTTNYGWQMPTPTDLVTDLPADFEVFGQAADGTVFANAALAVNKTIVDAKGDLIAATAADAVSRLAVGANATVLTADSAEATGMKWAAAAAAGFTPAGCAAFINAGSFVYSTGSQKIIDYTNEVYDTDSYHDAVTNNSRITIPAGKAGKYRISALAKTDATATNYAILLIYKNGSTVIGSGIKTGQMVRYGGIGGQLFALNGSVVLDLIVGDYIEIAYQSDASAGTYAIYSQFSAVFLGA